MNTADCNDAKRIRTTPPKSDKLARVFHRESERFANELHHNLNATPLGKLLGMMAGLPEIRHEKVLQAKNRIESGEIDRQFDAAMDKMLEELLNE